MIKNIMPLDTLAAGEVNSGIALDEISRKNKTNNLFDVAETLRKIVKKI